MSDDLYKLVKAITEYCAEHGKGDSAFLYPPNMRSFRVEVFGLFDRIAEASGVPNDTIGEWFNKEMDRLGK